MALRTSVVMGSSLGTSTFNLTPFIVPWESCASPLTPTAPSLVERPLGSAASVEGDACKLFVVAVCAGLGGGDAWERMNDCGIIDCGEKGWGGADVLVGEVGLTTALNAPCQNAHAPNSHSAQK